MKPQRRKAAILLELAFAAGAVDAVSYLGLGHVFTANMTGNTVLLGIAVARGAGSDAARSAVALGGFALGVAIGAGLIGSDGHWPRRASSVLWLETGFLALLLGAWSSLGASAGRLWLVAISAVAMGAQSAAVRSSDVRGVNTTYMTSTFLNAVSRLVLRARGIREAPSGATLPASAWGIYALGALAGALAEKSWQAPSAAIPLAILVAVSAQALVAR